MERRGEKDNCKVTQILPFGPVGDWQGGRERWGSSRLLSVPVMVRVHTQGPGHTVGEDRGPEARLTLPSERHYPASL